MESVVITNHQPQELLTNKSPGPDGFTDKFSKTLKEDLTPIRLKLIQKFKEAGMLLNS